MSKLLKMKEWLTLDDVAKRLSVSFDEEVTKNDVFQLCASNQLKISVFFAAATAGYFESRIFCPCLVGGYFVEEFRACMELVYKRKHSIALVEFNGFDLDNMDEAEYEQLHAETYSAIYSWYDSDSLTASYEEEFVLEGLYELLPEKNPRIFSWLNELALGNRESIYQGNPHTSILRFFVNSEDVEVIFNRADDEQPMLEIDAISRFVKRNYSQRQHEIYNPYITELFNLLVISSEHLIVFEQAFLEDQAKQLKQVPQKKQLQRNKVLTELINQRGEDELIALGRLGVWKELTNIDNKLFPVRDNPTDSTVKKFFGKQDLIKFKPGR